MSEQAHEEIYPMPLFVKLAVRDVAASATWYREALGFRSIFAMPGPDGTPVMDHIRLGKYQDILLIPEQDRADDAPRGRGVVVNMTTDDVDAIAARARAAGAAAVGPVVTPWNARELTVTDPDGYVITFSQQAAVRTFDDVISSMRRP